MEKIDFSQKSVFQPQNKGELSDSITRTWTEQAVECYSIGCDCKKCSLAGGNYSFVCQMPKVIKSLLKEIGVPELTVKPKKLA